MLFLTPNQQCQSTEGSIIYIPSIISEENSGRRSNSTLLFYNIHSVFTSVRTSRTDLNWLDMLAKCVWMQTKQFRLYTVYINADLNGFLIIFNYSCAYSTNATFTSNKEDMFSLLFVCLLLTLLKNFQTDLQEIFREGWQWPNEQMVKFLVAIWITVWIQGLLSRFVTIRRYGKPLTD